MDVGGIQNALTTMQKLFYKQLFRNALEVRKCVYMDEDIWN